MKPRIGSIALLTAVLGLAACGPLGPKPKSYITKQEFSLDGVKLISSDTTQNDDPTTFLQDSYLLSTDRRLLLRFESLKDYVNDVFLGNGKNIQIQVQLADGATGKENLRLCPLAKNWMMLATWIYAHPFGGGRWSTPGSDYSEGACLSAALTPPSPSVPAERATFVITQWFVDYARGRNENLGFALLSTRPIRVVGENSGSYSPRITFEKVVTVSPQDEKH